MRPRNLVIVFFMTAFSIVSLVLFWVQEEASTDSLPPTAASDAPAAKTPIYALDEGAKKSPSIAPAAAPDFKGIPLDPNKPKPLPTIVSTMPSTPPPMPMTVPEMPSAPPAMPNLVAPADGSMPYDPSVYTPKTRPSETRQALTPKPTPSPATMKSPYRAKAPAEKKSQQKP